MLELSTPNMFPQRAHHLRRFFAFSKALAATANSLKLAKSLRQRLWEDSPQLCRQLPNIGRLLASRLAEHGLGSFHALDQVLPCWEWHRVCILCALLASLLQGSLRPVIARALQQ